MTAVVRRFYAEKHALTRACIVYERGAAPNGADLVVAECSRLKMAGRIALALNAYKKKASAP